VAAPHGGIALRRHGRLRVGDNRMIERMERGGVASPPSGAKGRAGPFDAGCARPGNLR
jgi:hypothetical protein